MGAKFVKLKPVKARFKQLIKEFGTHWLVLDESHSVPCFNGRPGLWIQSVSKTHTRWVEWNEVEFLDRCPFCSFSPESNSDFCKAHR